MFIHLKPFCSPCEVCLIIVHKLHVLKELLIIHIAMAVSHVFLLFFYAVFLQFNRALGHTYAVVEFKLNIVKIILFLLCGGCPVVLHIFIFCHISCLLSSII